MLKGGVGSMPRYRYYEMCGRRESQAMPRGMACALGSVFELPPWAYTKIHGREYNTFLKEQGGGKQQRAFQSVDVVDLRKEMQEATKATRVQQTA